MKWPQYFVLCDYGPEFGRAWAEVDPAKADRETVLEWLRTASSPTRLQSWKWTCRAEHAGRDRGVHSRSRGKDGGLTRSGSMIQTEKEVQALILDSVALNRAEADGGPNNLWALTLNPGPAEQVYLLSADHLRLLAPKIFERLSS